MRFRLTLDGRLHEVYVGRDGPKTFVEVDGRRLPGRIARRGEGFEANVGAKRVALSIEQNRIVCDGHAHDAHLSRLRVTTRGEAAGALHAGAGDVKSPMPGKIVAVGVAVGDRVEKGASLVVLEAMKMQNEIAATTAGKIVEVRVKTGDIV